MSFRRSVVAPLTDGSPGSFDTDVSPREMYNAMVAYGAIDREPNSLQDVASLSLPDRVAPIAPAAEVSFAKPSLSKLARVPSHLSPLPTFGCVRSSYVNKRISSRSPSRAKGRWRSGNTISIVSWTELHLRTATSILQASGIKILYLADALTPSPGVQLFYPRHRNQHAYTTLITARNRACVYAHIRLGYGDLAGAVTNACYLRSIGMEVIVATGGNYEDIPKEIYGNFQNALNSTIHSGVEALAAAGFEANLVFDTYTPLAADGPVLGPVIKAVGGNARRLSLGKAPVPQLHARLPILTALLPCPSGPLSFSGIWFFPRCKTGAVIRSRRLNFQWGSESWT